MNGAYGDSFIVQTPQLDNFANRLYQQQQQRQQAGYQDYIATQQQLQKEFANVRSADMPDLVKAYNDFKATRQQMLFNEKLKRNPQAYAQATQAANEKLSQVYQLISGSKQLMDLDKQTSADLAKNRDLYSDDAANTLGQWQQLPLSERVKIGATSADQLLYKGSNTDFGALEAKAVGTQTKTALPEVKSDDGSTVYMQEATHGNNPLQFYSIYAGELAKRSAGQDASLGWKNTPQEVKDYYEQQYKNLPDSYWQAHGVPRQDLSQANGQSDAEKFAIMKAQQYALANPPQIIKTNPREDVQAKQSFELKKLAIENQNATNRLAIAEKYKEAYHKFAQADNKKDQSSILDNLITQQYNSSAGNPIQFHLPDGTKINGKPIQMPSDLAKNYVKYDATNTAVFPSRWYMSSDKKYIIPYYPTGKDAKGNDVLNLRKSDLIPVATTYKPDLGKYYLSKKDAASEMTDEDFTDGGDNSGSMPNANSQDTKAGNGYTNITQTNKGTIGIKNGKWYDIKTGKPVE